MSVQVMAHRRREGLVADLLDRLDLDEDHVTWDTDDNRWHTGKAAMAAGAARGQAWTCVIQDDALPCRDYTAGMELALDHVPPEVIVQPYVGTRRPMQGYVTEAVEKAVEQNATWIVMRALMWGVAIIVPTYTVAPMLVWCERRAWPNYDKRVGQFYYAKLAWPVYCTHPSLVEHREVPSLVGHGDGRIAHHFLGEDASALDIDWAGPVVRMRGLNSLRRRRDAPGVLKLPH
jgi:hypothetical protein